MTNPLLAVIEFQAPAYLAGLLAVALPVVAHLKGWSRAAPVVFPAVRFLREAAVESAARRRPIDLALLLIRMAAIAAIVAAFAMPVWKSNSSSAAGAKNNAGREVVFVLDASASMQRMNDLSTCFDQAVREIQGELAGLDPWVDRAAILVAAGDRTMRLLPQLTHNMDALRTRLLDVQPTFARGNLDQALIRALELPQVERATDGAGASANTERGTIIREVVVYTDGQASEWDAPGSIESMMTGSASDIRIHNVNRSSAGQVNHAVRSVRVDDAEPFVGETAVVTVEIVSSGESLTPAVVVRLDAPGRSYENVIAVDPDVTASTVSFAIECDQVGLNELAVSLVGDDAFEPDDSLRTAMRVLARREMVLITDVSSESGNDHVKGDFTAAELIAAALAPDIDSPYRVRVIDGSSADALALDRFAGLIVVNLTALSDAAGISVAHYVRGGGSLFWIADSESSCQALVSMLERAGVGEFDRSDWPIHSPTSDEPSRHLVFDSFEESVAATDEAIHSTAPFREFDARARNAIESIAFEAVFPTFLDSQADDIWLRFDTGEPALTMQYIGAGRLAVFAGSWMLDSTDLMREPIGVAVVHEIVRALHPGASVAPTTYVGGTLELTLPSPIRTLSDLRIEPELPRVSYIHDRTDESADSRVRVGPIEHPGPVHVFESDGGALLALGFAQIDPRESDVSSLSTDEVRRIETAPEPASAHAVTSDSAPTARSASLERSHQLIALWPFALLGAVLLLITEHVVLLFVSSPTRSQP